MAGLLETTVKRITIRTTLFPDIVIDEPFADTAATGVPPTLLMRLVKPEIEIETAFTNPVLISPFGRPAAGWGKAVPAVVVATLAVTGALAVFGLITIASGAPRLPATV